LKLIEENKEKLLERFEEFKFSIDDIIDILELSDISNSMKQELIEQKSKFDDEELMELLSLLPSEYQKIINQDGKQTTLNDTNYNKEFIELLKEKKLITSDKSEKNNKIRLYIAKKDI
jgi:DNA-binding transcriptional MerR regulator